MQRAVKRRRGGVPRGAARVAGRGGLQVLVEARQRLFQAQVHEGLRERVDLLALVQGGPPRGRDGLDPVESAAQLAVDRAVRVRVPAKVCDRQGRILEGREIQEAVNSEAQAVDDVAAGL